jgi:hypothetical protein
VKTGRGFKQISNITARYKMMMNFSLWQTHRRRGLIIMEDQDILSMIYDLQVDIFNGQFNALPRKFASFSTGLKSIYRSIPSQHELYFKQSLLMLIQAFENRDYLLVADILEFKLKTLLIEVFAKGGHHEII